MLREAGGAQYNVTGLCAVHVRTRLLENRAFLVRGRLVSEEHDERLGERAAEGRRSQSRRALGRRTMGPQQHLTGHNSFCVCISLYLPG